jgi:hypothetical protein
MSNITSLHILLGTLLLPGILNLSHAATDSVATLQNAIGAGRVGLFDTQDFRLSSGHCSDCNAPAQALWYFQDDLVATPKRNPAGFDPSLRVQDDVRAWAAQHPGDGGDEYPALLWLGSPQIATGTLSADGNTLTLPDQQTVPFAVTPKIPANLSYYDASSVQHFAGRTLQLRGSMGENSFVARTIWPVDYALDFTALTLQPLQGDETLLSLVRSDGAQPAAPLSARLLWQRDENTARDWNNKPVLAVMLNGAQGDDDEAHGGHFAIVTGAFGAKGEWDNWLVNNFYNLGSVSEKGTIAAMLPMDAYMADLNSGQSWYRPSYMLVAVLRQPRAAQHVQGALARVYNRFYRQDFPYHHAMANCTGISMDTLRSLHWNIPQQGPTNALKALVALPFMTIKDRSLASGEQAFDYLMAEQTNLYPFVGFDAVGRDLLERISTGKAGNTGLDAMLAEDIEALLYVRIPQFPSSRVLGQAPVASLDEYMSRVPEDRSQWKIVPVPPRHFPQELKDPNAIADTYRPSQVATLAYAGVIGLVLLGVVGRIARRHKKS